MDLLRDINKKLQPKDEFELALESMEDSNDKEPSKGEDKSSMESPTNELQRIADHWKERAKQMSKDELLDAIGDDLEQLDYNPEEVEKFVPQVMKMIGR